MRLVARRLDDASTEENVEVKGDVVDVFGAGLLEVGFLRDDEPSVREGRLLVASGVRPRRTLGCCDGGPQADCCVRVGLEVDVLSEPEAVEDWAEGEGEVI